jgi:hypothetical protein
LSDIPSNLTANARSAEGPPTISWPNGVRCAREP